VENWELEALLKEIFRMLRDIREILENPPKPSTATTIKLIPGPVQDN
jgi:hypothetical protein